MRTIRLTSKVRNRGAALVIVLAFVVLVTGLVVAYLARTGTDRQLAYGTFSENRADLLARSALDVVVGDLKQEIVAGSTVTTVNNINIDLPTGAAGMIPKRSGNPSVLPDPIPNLVRRSWSNDTNLTIRSRASAVNSSTDISLNGRSVTPARWNRHYLVPRVDPSSTAVDSTPVATFTTPDWVLVTTTGPQVLGAPSTSVVGRYSYAIYDEGGLLDLNVAGFPHATPLPAVTPAAPQPINAPNPPYAPGSYPAGYTAATYTAQKLGRKGTAAFVDLSILPASASTFFPATQVNNLVGWRDYASTQPGADFSTGFTFDASAASRYYSVALSNLATFLQTSGTTWNGRTDQAFASRQQLLAFRTTTGFSQNLLQYLGTFSREFNRPTWSPSTPTDSTIPYAAQAETSTSINRDLATVRATASFPRNDGTTAIIGEPLLKTRFPLRRLSWLTYNGPSALRTIPPASPVPSVTDPNYDMWQLVYLYGVPQTYLAQGTAANIKASFGLVWDSRAYVVGATPQIGQQWFYTSPSSANSGGTFNGTTGTAATVIKKLNTVQSENREPDFVEILKAVILNGSIGLGSNNTAPTFIMADPKYYDTTGGKSADYQLMQIGGNIMDAWDTDNVPPFISFNGNEPIGVENLPYLNKLVYMPSFASGSNDFFDAWLVPSLWNPHQNAPGTGTIRVALNGTGQYWGWGTSKSGSTVTTTKAGPISLPATMDMSANGFAVPAPQIATPIAINGPVTKVTDPSLPYWGFHFPFNSSTPFATLVTKQDADTAYPDFGGTIGASSLELQIQIPGTTSFIPYQTWKIAATLHPLICQNAKTNFAASNKLQDPEFIALDPRTVRFGIWGTDANSQTGPPGKTKKDYTQGEKDSVDEQSPASRFEQVTLYSPQGTSFTASPTANLYLYSSNTGVGSTLHYVDLDGVQRYADFTSDNGTTNGSTIMFGANGPNRQQLPSAPFQSVSELGQVCRDQPWKTLAFTIANSGDGGLLDAFTMQDVPLVAGRTSLNSRQAPVLTAIMSQVTKKIAGTGVIPNGSTDTTVSNISNALVGLTITTPMVSKGELVTRLSGDSSVTSLLNKEARESVVRALSESCQTRTWNLMIDVIAQSGRYPTTAINPSQFVVEGEKRYWLHVAIDRFTGEVIDQQLEAVYE